MYDLLNNYGLVDKILNSWYLKHLCADITNNFCLSGG